MPITFAPGADCIYSEAEKNFRARVEELGGTCVYEAWEGTHNKHHVICANDHDCYITPGYVQQGGGICRICAGNDPITAEKNFRIRIAELGGTCAYDTWQGTVNKHHVICVNGHDCYPRPNQVQQGHGICRICANRDTITAEKNFRTRVAELGGTCAYDTWQGVNRPHHIICTVGHNCYPRPTAIMQRQGICRVCAGRDPTTAETNFRSRIIELGGTCAYDKWLGSDKPHHVICMSGHDCYPRPGNVQQGSGICRICIYSPDDIFYIVRNPDDESVKFGITHNDPRPRLGKHRRDGYTEVIRIVGELPIGHPRDIEANIINALREVQIRPVKGREYYSSEAFDLIMDVADSFLLQYEIVGERIF